MVDVFIKYDCCNCVYSYDEDYPIDKFPDEYKDMMINHSCGGLIDPEYKGARMRICKKFRLKREQIG